MLHAFDAEGAVRDAWLVVEEVETRLCREREREIERERERERERVCV